MNSVPIVKMWNSARVRLGLFILLALLCLLATFDLGCRLGFIAQDNTVWITVVIAVASMGILFFILVFSLQSRMIFAPLRQITEAVKQVLEGQYQPGVCPRLKWSKKDEFGVFVHSVNEMVSTLAEMTQALTEEKDYQLALLASIPDCVCLFDREARLVKVYKQPDLVSPIRGLVAGEPLKEPFFLEQDGKQLLAAIGRTFAAGKPQRAFVSLREAAEAFRHFEVKACKINDEHALVVLKDISREKRETDSQKLAEGRQVRVEKIESLGTLAAGIAHDVNSMLTVIRNTLSVTWPKPKEQENEAIRTILQAADKGTELTRELMTYAGQSMVKMNRSDPNEIVLALEKLLQGVMASNVILELNLGQELPRVDADPNQFWKVLLNLLKNASEAMNGLQGAVRISTYPYTLTDENKRDFFCTHTLTCEPGVIFEVSDTGVGIPKEIQKRIFEPFFSTKSVGRGLGLATAFGIVDAHNGAIALTSEVGKGTMFRVWLPVSKGVPQQAESEKKRTQESSGVYPPRTQARPCVLIIEDDRAVLQTTRILLQSMGIDAVEASSKRDAINVFRKHLGRVNLILLDAMIDNLDNVKLVAVLREIKPEIPIVIVSGYSEKRIAELFASQRYNGYLGKPYTRDQLMAALRPFVTLP